MPSSEPEEITDELLDRAATALTNNLERLIGAIPSSDPAYMSTAELDVGRRNKRRHTNYFCWKCARPIWSDQPRRQLGERRYHLADCY